jgi:2-C-methyl-D-erythritol 4-phosphate cytidylyltransferase
VRHVVVVAPTTWVERAQNLLDRLHGSSPTSDAGGVTVVAGGAERQDSVAAGLTALPDDVDVVLVHDAARCLAPPSLVARVLEAVLAGHDAVVPALPVTDTIKLVGDGMSTLDTVVRRTVDRDTLRIAQTPQGFVRATLSTAHAAAGLSPHLSTDDAEMAERVTEVVVVPGDPLAFKITGPQDLAYAEWLLSRGTAQ